MPNDAKLGLVVGVGLVIAVAVLFFRKDSPVPDPAAANVKPAPAVQPTTQPAPAAPAARNRPVVAHSGIRTASTPAPGEARCHTVQEGETLFKLAQHYYGDPGMSKYLLRANRLSSPDSLEPGTVIVIPDSPLQPEGQ